MATDTTKTLLKHSPGSQVKDATRVFVSQEPPSAVLDLDAAILTHIGLEDVCKKEVESLTGASASSSTGTVYVRAPLLKLCELCYLSRSALRVMVVLGTKKASDAILGATNLAQKVDLGEWLTQKTSFACRSSIPEIGGEIAATVGGILNDRTNAPVNLSTPDVTIIVHKSDDMIIVGVDMGGDDIGKRDYRIFIGSDSLRGTIAYGLLAIAGYDGQSMADIFCRGGVIPIEAALYAHGIAPHKHERIFPFRKLAPLAGIAWDAFFDDCDKRAARESKNTIVSMDDSFGAVASAKKNAKIAGMHQYIDFSRTDLEFLDAKFGKGSLDMIATMPPQPSARINGKPLEKALEQLFYQAEFILKKKGKLAVLTKGNVDLLKTFADKYKFLLVQERVIWQGGLALTVLVFTR